MANYYAGATDTASAMRTYYYRTTYEMRYQEDHTTINRNHYI